MTISYIHIYIFVIIDIYIYISYIYVIIDIYIYIYIDIEFENKTVEKRLKTSKSSALDILSSSSKLSKFINFLRISLLISRY